ncbi:peptidase [Lasius niger]|uniref:Peptidase n=1 Tax=Lasius niger TaxID=67767 RepID=A0A0J7K534_LASNI|nr:peptidase [Lasius niger]
MLLIKLVQERYNIDGNETIVDEWLDVTEGDEGDTERVEGGTEGDEGGTERDEGDKEGNEGDREYDNEFDKEEDIVLNYLQKKKLSWKN